MFYLSHSIYMGVVIIISIKTQIKGVYVFQSGGHFNPAVSLCICLCGGMELLHLLPHILAQMCGGMIGAALAKVRT